MNVKKSLLTILAIGLLSIFLWWLPAAKVSSSLMNPGFLTSSY